MLAEGEDILGAVFDAREGRGMPLGDDDEFRRDDPQAMAEFRICLPPILAGRHDAKFGRSEFDFDVFGPVLRQDRDAVATPKALREKPLGQAIHAVIQFAVGDLPLALLDRSRARIAGRPASETTCRL